MQNLITTFRSIGDLSRESEEVLINAIKRVEYPAKIALQKQNEICNKIFFIEKGIARTYYFKDGKDITFWIAMENDFIGSMSSFFMRSPSAKRVETIEKCILWEFEYESLEALFSTSQELEKVGRKFSNYGISLLKERLNNLHFYSAKERYDILLEKQPQIIQRIPLGIVASYLGITQETLSRIRGQK